MTIDELLRGASRRDYAAMPETDALTEEDGLEDARLLDVRFSLQEACLAMLFDLRNALQFRMADVAVLVMREVKQTQFTRTGQPGFLFAPEVVTSAPCAEDDLFGFELVCSGGSRVRAVSAAAEFFVGDIPGLPPAPPDFGEDDEVTIAAGMPAWGSPFTPGWATFIDKPGTPHLQMATSTASTDEPSIPACTWSTPSRRR